MGTFRWASGDLLYKLLSEGGEPLTNWDWSGVDPLEVAWRGDSADVLAAGRTLRQLVGAHFTVRYIPSFYEHCWWRLTRKEQEG